MKQQNTYSHLTAKEREFLSFPSKYLFDNKLLHGRILDFGCGYGMDVKKLKDRGLDIEGYDKHYFPQYPEGRFDTIICFYVLNVLMAEEQARVLMELSRLVKPGGNIYIAVRRDLTNEGFRIHKVHQKPTYQCKVRLPFESVFLNEHCEIYRFKLFNQVSSSENQGCPFCNPEPLREIICESATAYAIYDKFPVNEGHALIIPKRHTADYFDLTFKEQSACIFMMNFVKDIIRKRNNPDGFNVGINIGETAGQTIPHVHIHLIPRYTGDVEKPRGGIRGVIPGKRDY